MIYYRLFGLLLRYILYIAVFIIVSLYAHTCNIYAHFLSFYTFIRSFLTPLDLHIQIHVYSTLLVKYLERITCIVRNPGFLSARSSSLVSLHAFFILVDSLILYIFDSVVVLFNYSQNIYPCVEIYVTLQCFYCFYS